MRHWKAKMLGSMCLLFLALILAGAASVQTDVPPRPDGLPDDLPWPLEPPPMTDSACIPTGFNQWDCSGQTATPVPDDDPCHGDARNEGCHEPGAVFSVDGKSIDELRDILERHCPELRSIRGVTAQMGSVRL